MRRGWPAVEHVAWLMAGAVWACVAIQVACAPEPERCGMRPLSPGWVATFDVSNGESRACLAATDYQALRAYLDAFEVRGACVARQGAP